MEYYFMTQNKMYLVSIYYLEIILWGYYAAGNKFYI